MTNALDSRKVRILGVPLDLGAGRRGVDMGPRPCASPAWAGRCASSATRSTTRRRPRAHPEEQPPGDERLKYKEPIRDAAEELAHRV